MEQSLGIHSSICVVQERKFGKKEKSYSFHMGNCYGRFRRTTQSQSHSRIQMRMRSCWLVWMAIGMNILNISGLTMMMMMMHFSSTDKHAHTRKHNIHQKRKLLLFKQINLRLTTYRINHTDPIRSFPQWMAFDVVGPLLFPSSC